MHTKLIIVYQKLFVLLIIWSLPPFIFSDIKIEITHGVNTAYPIAVIPFTNDDNETIHESNNDDVKNIASIIAADLRNSGKFNTLPIMYLPYQPSKLTDIIPTFWEKLGINTVVLGRIKTKNENYIISYQLIDTSNNPALIILDNQYEVEKKHLRYTAHTISNEIFEKLTGIKGAFCTRIAYILYNKNTKYSYELYISDYDGYNPVSICRSSEPLMSPAWSPDGTKLAYVTFSSAGHSKLVIQILQNGLIDNIIKFPKHNGAPAWSPDGTKLAFSLSKTGSLNLYIMDLLSNNIQQITSNRYNNTEPSWFPDSQNLAYTSDQGGSPQIYKININNNQAVQRISWLNGSNQKPNISADGKFMVMVNRNKGKQCISKLNFLNGQEKILTTDEFLADTPSIAPNGIMFMYSAIALNNDSELLLGKSNNINNITTKSVVNLASIDGKFKAHLNGTKGSIRFPTWSSSLSCPNQ